jgi:D-threo-aldose 1-dehydrogenase
MRRHILGQTGIDVSQLGFGCVKLTTHRERRDAVRVLENAFARGITHFDVARAYGFGRAESILGEFLRGKRDRVTVATKFGIQPPSGVAGNRWIIDLAKKILSPFPSLLRRAKQRGAALVHSGVFTPAIAIQSLETSLRELHTDYVDLLLLHEATPADSASHPLIEALRQQVARGTVRSFGVASDFRKLGEDPHGVPAAYQVLQFEDNAHARNLRTLSQGTERGVITHSIFQPASPLQNVVAAQPALARKFSSEINANLVDPTVIGSLLLHYALRSNLNGVVLFSSSDPQRVLANVHDAESGRYDERQLSQFVEFVDMALTPISLFNAGSTPSRQAAS